MSSTGQNPLSTAAPLMNSAAPSSGVKAGSDLPSFQTVLVCTDFSVGSEYAVMEGVRLCKAAGGHLLLLHASECGALSTGSEEGIECVAALLRKENSRLEDLAQELRKSGVSVEATLEDGSASNAILRCIASRNIDLIIMGTQGATGMKRMICGSTAEEVLRKASCPVMTVGPQAAAQCTGAARGPVVFATDFHASSTEAVRYAATLAHVADVPLHCLHILPLSIENDGGISIIPYVMTDALCHLLTENRINITDPVCAVTYGSEVSHAIVDYAKAHGAQAIVLGVQRASWLVAHMSPHVTYRIIVTASCPVLTVASDSTYTSPQGVAACDRFGGSI